MDNALDWWPAPAKLNLMLRILGRRSDGYHQLQTVFQFLSVGDELAFEVVESDISRAAGDTALYTDDLTIRAAHALQAYTGCKLGVRIHLQKMLPVGGGVGGGSSDAATTLFALNKLWSLGLATAELASIGLSLGADVPIFLHGYAAWAEGVGESLSAIALQESWYIVMTPPVFVSTQAVFTHPDLPRSSSSITPDAFADGDRQNDCLETVLSLYPEVKEAYEWFTKLANVQMTGTGASLFATFSTKEEAEQVAQKIPKQWPFFIAQGKNVSPLLEKKI